MAMNTPNWQKQYNATNDKLIGTTAEEGVIIVNTTNNNLHVMDGTTAGGHPLAKQATKIKSGSPNVKINNGTEASLGGDITITVLPGTIPAGMVVATDPEGQEPGQYLQVNYTDKNGAEQKYYVNLNKLVDKYLAGNGIKIEDNTVSIDAATFVSAIAASGGGIVTNSDGELMVAPGQLIAANAGLDTNDDGKLTVKLEDIVDTTGMLQIVDGKISMKAILSADAGNNLKAGTDGGLFYPANLGTL